ncbi:PP2C family protein-serine/threonine phosphatase [Actinacidiphila glaucinigra]|uniref:PP2C family protein-serine/threonine phosphatase n=1 Tax=Actinacidiphila glaucinigra TaxID=235986 RepID=UPI002DD7B6FB|nr:PP2C family protein-serine/threonine phosphatase [Actinacidiphila glaucinigra]WSD64502.1 serine/threonine-protein phosphatase [Actinacidiphila glaucinigra]
MHKLIRRAGRPAPVPVAAGTPHGRPAGGRTAPRRRQRSRSWQALRLSEVGAPVVLVLIITTIGFVAPSDVHLASLLIAAPALMAAISTARATSAVAALSLVAAVICDVHDGLLRSPILPTHIAALVAVSAFLVAFCSTRDRNRREASQLRAISEAAQQVVLRPLPRRIEDLKVASAYRAAERMAEVGGDLYAAARTPYGIRLLIGDVKGKGLQALDDTAALLGAFREAVHQHRTLPALAAALEGSVRRHVAEASATDAHAPERFITALLVEFPPCGGLVRTVSCGHPLPLLLRDGLITAPAGPAPAPPLGLAGLGPAAYREDCFPLAPRDLLLLYTDGLAEARDRSGAFYSVADRGIPRDAATCDPESLLRDVMADLLRHTDGRLNDDVALVAVQYVPEPGQPEPEGCAAMAGQRVPTTRSATSAPEPPVRR